MDLRTERHRVLQLTAVICLLVNKSIFVTKGILFFSVSFFSVGQGRALPKNANWNKKMQVFKPTTKLYTITQ